MTSRSWKKPVKKLALAMLALLVATPVAAQRPLSLDHLMREPAKYDRRPVIVRGTVGIVESAAGRPVFQLIDGASIVRVMGPPQPAVRGGERVEVEGTFSLSGNLIDAFRVSWR